MAERELIRLKKAAKITGIRADTLKYHILKGNLYAEKRPKKPGGKIEKYSFHYVVDKKEVKDFETPYYRKDKKLRPECRTCKHNQGYRCRVYISRADPIVRDGMCYSYEEELDEG